MNRLQQGDVLHRTSRLEDLLSEYFPYYVSHVENKFFIVLTQSCDLAIRENGQCAAHYISISPVRPLKAVIERETFKLRYDNNELKFNFADQSRMNKLRDFMERLINNNEPDYFFLYRQQDKGLDNDYCAFLKLSIAFKVDHYKTLLDAKILQLEDSFQHKIGYNIGNSYSRVGTKDWLSDKVKDRHEFSSIISAMLKNVDGYWLEKSVYNDVKKQLKNRSNEDLSFEDFVNIVEDVKKKNKSNKERAIDIISSVLSSRSIPDDEVNKIKTALKNRPELMSLIK
ncbi:hypothetical protein [Desulfonatronum parangueonense]